MPSAIISAVIKDWLKSLFLMNILLNKGKTDSLNMTILMNTDY